MTEKKEIELAGAKVEALVEKFQELFSTTVEGDVKEQVRGMSEYFAALCFVEGEISAYLLSLGLSKESLEFLKRSYQKGGYDKVMETMVKITSPGSLD